MASDVERAAPAGGSEVVAGRDIPSCRIWLYRGDGEDTPVDLDSPLPDPHDKQVLWADVDLECADGLDRLWGHLAVDGLVDGLKEAGDRPSLTQHEGVLQLTVTALGADSDFAPVPLHCLVGPNWVVTLHNGELDLVNEFNKPFHGETRLGDLDGPRFLSVVLDWQVSGYFRVIEELQTEIDELDTKVLADRPDERDLFDRLIELRSRVRTLRNTLSRHRPIVSLLSHPDSSAVVGSEAAEVYQQVGERLQQALDEIDTTRGMLVGSFDVFMTRTAQATNDIMKRLTIVSVLLLPAVVIAGIMGMNFQVGLFEQAWIFWVVIALMVLLAGATLYVAKRRDWL